MIRLSAYIVAIDPEYPPSPPRTTNLNIKYAARSSQKGSVERAATFRVSQQKALAFRNTKIANASGGIVIALSLHIRANNINTTATAVIREFFCAVNAPTNDQRESIMKTIQIMSVRFTSQLIASGLSGEDANRTEALRATSLDSIPPNPDRSLLKKRKSVKVASWCQTKFVR